MFLTAKYLNKPMESLNKPMLTTKSMHKMDIAWGFSVIVSLPQSTNKQPLHPLLQVSTIANNFEQEIQEIQFEFDAEGDAVIQDIPVFDVPNGKIPEQDDGILEQAHANNEIQAQAGYCMGFFGYRQEIQFEFDTEGYAAMQDILVVDVSNGEIPE